MPRTGKNARDITQLSGKPLTETQEPSTLHIDSEEWLTSTDLAERNLPFTPDVIDNMTVFVLANPNMNSSHLFRADILFDSMKLLKTPQEKEKSFAGDVVNADEPDSTDEVKPLAAKEVAGFDLKRTIVRRLIPRNPKLDRPLEQTCHFYEAEVSGTAGQGEKSCKRLLVVYTPHVTEKEELPWYHPLIRSLAFLYDFEYDGRETSGSGSGTMSLHFSPFPTEPMSTRLERTLLALINTQVRLARGTRSSTTADGGNYNPSKDNVIPQHLIQNTYSRLKLKYAAGLCEKWVEETEPSKHVFEDLSIAAFLIELWRNMYGVSPPTETEETTTTTEKESDQQLKSFPGFVDVACGNGVLVYVLLMEGYQGWGFDARRRKSWSIFPTSVQERLKEATYVPKPFSEAMVESGREELLSDLGVETQTGVFPKDTFIISNHADELTLWTPLMAALSNPESPSPFLAIPCCSHSLSGARFRYPPPKPKGKKTGSTSKELVEPTDGHEVEQNSQPASGDLKALRAAKQQEKSTEEGQLNSMYGSLTAKAMSVAEEIGYGVEKTLLRIPSTRNMGVVGGRKRVTQEWKERRKPSDEKKEDAVVVEKAMEVVQRECSREGGIEAAAKIWIERAKWIHSGPGKGSRRGGCGH